MNRARTANQDSVKSPATTAFGRDRMAATWRTLRIPAGFDRNPGLQCAGALNES